MIAWNCRDLGHHVHEPNGAVYMRYEGHPGPATITVKCCHCGTTTPDMPTTGKGPKPAGPMRHECGSAL